MVHTKDEGALRLRDKEILSLHGTECLIKKGGIFNLNFKWKKYVDVDFFRMVGFSHSTL